VSGATKGKRSAVADSVEAVTDNAEAVTGGRRGKLNVPDASRQEGRQRSKDSSREKKRRSSRRREERRDERRDENRSRRTPPTHYVQNNPCGAGLSNAHENHNASDKNQPASPSFRGNPNGSTCDIAGSVGDEVKKDDNASNPAKSRSSHSPPLPQLLTEPFRRFGGMITKNSKQIIHKENNKEVGEDLVKRTASPVRTASPGEKVGVKRISAGGMLGVNIAPFRQRDMLKWQKAREAKQEREQQEREQQEREQREREQREREQREREQQEREERERGQQHGGERDGKITEADGSEAGREGGRLHCLEI
jgi:hypothetical protein